MTTYGMVFYIFSLYRSCITCIHPSATCFSCNLVLRLFRATPRAYGIWHIAVPRLEVELELQMPATAIATEGSELCLQPSHSSQQHWIPHPLRMARDQTRVLMGTSRIHFHCATTGTPLIPTLNHQEACHPVPRQL